MTIAKHIRQSAGKRSMKRTSLHALWIAALMICCCAFSAQSVHAAGNFTIEDYDIEMQVNEDDTYLITETLDVHFTKPSHGIYRVIPYKATLDRDGQETTFYGRVRDFNMLSGQPVSREKGEDAYYYRIGDEDEYADTDTTYKLSYVFDMKGDHLSGADEVYYNLVGTTWEAQAIEHVSFRVIFPKDIDTSKVGIKTGSQEYVPFDTEGTRIIKGDTYQDTLYGLTIRALLPQGYFTKQASTSNLLILLLLAVIGAATLFGFVLWRRYGKDPAIVETEEFYPPEGLSAPEVAYLENGTLMNRQVISMLLTLADKGYVKIVEKEVARGKKKKRTKTEYEIIKLRSAHDATEDEQTFMNGLFENGEDSVELSDLKNTFYTTVDQIVSDIEDRYEDRLYDPKAANFAYLLRGIGFAVMIAMFVIFKILNGSPFIVGHGDFLIYCVFDIIEIAFPIIGFYGIAKWINRPKKSIPGFVFGFIGWSVMILVGFGLAVICDTCMGPQIVFYMIGLGMLFLLFLMAALCERKTDEYAGLLGKIRGYKRFLTIAEKDRMEALAESDPNYYYRNLAFAFALGVTSVYAERFASMANTPPEWYVSSGYVPGTTFDSVSMMDSMDHMMSTASSTMTSSPSGDGGGGGGFSGGGGAGGGGGGSW